MTRKAYCTDKLCYYLLQDESCYHIMTILLKKIFYDKIIICNDIMIRVSKAHNSGCG